MVAQNSSTRSAQSGPFTRKSKVINVDPASMPTLTTQAVDIAFAGCKAGDRVTVTPQVALEVGIVAAQALCLSDGHVTWTLANVTAGTINPAALNVLVSVGTEH
jgi:hypothetical protein